MLNVPPRGWWHDYAPIISHLLNDLYRLHDARPRAGRLHEIPFSFPRSAWECQRALCAPYGAERRFTTPTRSVGASIVYRKCELPMPNPISAPRLLLTSLLLILLLSACGSEPEPTPTPTSVPFPTFTPTVMVESQAVTATPVAPAATATVASVAEVPTPAPTSPPAPAPLAPQLTVDGDGVNIRSGPDTAYEIVGTGNTGQTFPVTGRTAAGDWWQICCFDGQPGWIFAALTTGQDGGRGRRGHPDPAAYAHPSPRGRGPHVRTGSGCS